MRKDLSIASYSFHGMLEEGTMDIYGYLESVRYRYGMVYADIWNGFIKSYELDDLKKVKRYMNEKGMKLANLCCDGAHPWNDDKEELEKLNAMAEKCLLAAEVLEARTVRIDLGVWANRMSEEQAEYIADRFRSYAERGRNTGFMIGPENHWGASRRMDIQKRMQKEVNHPNYAMLLHLGNWIPDGLDGEAEEKGQGFEALDLLSLEERDARDAEMAAFAVHTHIDYPHCARADEVIPNLLNAGYKGVLGIEHHSAKEEYSNAAWQVASVNKALAPL